MIQPRAPPLEDCGGGDSLEPPPSPLPPLACKAWDAGVLELMLGVDEAAQHRLAASASSRASSARGRDSLAMVSACGHTSCAAFLAEELCASQPLQPQPASDLFSPRLDVEALTADQHPTCTKFLTLAPMLRLYRLQERWMCSRTAPLS